MISQKYLQGYHGLVKTLVDNIYYYQDELGSTSHIADASGALLEYYKYDLYGKPKFFDALNNQQSTTNYSVHDLFAGQRYVPELGLYDDRNRFMSPDLGRFLQPDPIGFKGDASNLYRYCGNDWANKTDPMGLEVLMSSEADAQVADRIESLAQAMHNNGTDKLLPVIGEIISATESYHEGNKGAMAFHIAMAVTDASPKYLIGAAAKVGAIYKGTKLARNLAKEGRAVKKGVEHAHHIVAQNAERAQEARNVLSKFNIDINEAANGVGLSKDFHQSLHTKQMYEGINKAAEAFRSPEEARAGLREIGMQLKETEQGSMPLKDPEGDPFSLFQSFERR